MKFHLTFFHYLYKNSKYFFYIWLFIIMIISSLPQIMIPEIKSTQSNIRLDYLVHFWEFFILAIFFGLWRLNKRFKQTFHNWISYILIGWGLAFLVEIYQYLIPDRSFNIIDYIYNSIGYITGIFLVYIFLKIKNPGTRKI